MSLVTAIYSKDLFSKTEACRRVTMNPPQDIRSTTVSVKQLDIHAQVQPKFLEKVDKEIKTTKPLWFVFSGIGSQWVGMGLPLLQIPAFREEFQQCARVLEPNGVDLENFLRTGSNKRNASSETMNIIAVITAIQVSLVEVLKRAGSNPDGIIGFSIGEIAAAYADGCVTRSQAMKIAFAIGHHTARCTGSMAALGMSKQDVQREFPDVEIACVSGAHATTVAASDSDIEVVVREAKNKGYLAVKVDSTNVAFHSSHIQKAGSRLERSLKKILHVPRQRTSRWKSAVAITLAGSLCDASYFVRNIQGQVDFATAMYNIPPDAVVLDLGASAQLSNLITEARGCTTVLAAASKHDRDANSNLPVMLTVLQRNGLVNDDAMNLLHVV